MNEKQRGADGACEERAGFLLAAEDFAQDGFGARMTGGDGAGLAGDAGVEVRVECADFAGRHGVGAHDAVAFRGDRFAEVVE